MSDILHSKGPTMPPPDVQAWLNELDLHERADLEQTWALAECGREAEPTDKATQAAWTTMRQQVAMHAPSTNNRPKQEQDRPAQTSLSNRSTLRRRYRVSAWATALASALVVLVVVFMLQDPTTHITVPLGQTQTHTLPDGSTAVLNSGSTLAYTLSEDASERRVLLTGEAYFTVTSTERPFIVETFNAAVTVLGTQFNVKAWPDAPAPETQVVLEEGAVYFAALGHAPDGVILEPGQLSRLAAASSQPSAPEIVDTARHLAWQTGGFFFKNESIGTILAEAERRFDLSIRITDPAIAQDSLVLFLQRVEQPEALFSTISRFRGYTFRATPQGYDVLP